MNSANTDAIPLERQASRIEILLADYQSCREDERVPDRLVARVLQRATDGSRCGTACEAEHLEIHGGDCTVPGMAHVSGSIMAAYIAFGIEARHLLTAVIMTAPGTIMMAKILEPETEVPETLGGVKVEIPRTDVNVLDAAARGTSDGLYLMLNVIAMLVSFIALIALVNGLFGWIHGGVAWFPATLQTVLGWIFRPIAWVMGVPWHDSGVVGSLLGERMVINEFIAYADLGPMKGTLNPVSFTIATFALCGFANLSSVGIQIGGIGALAPDRKHDLARLGFRAMIAGTLANFLSATLAGILL